MIFLIFSLKVKRQKSTKRLFKRIHKQTGQIVAVKMINSIPLDLLSKINEEIQNEIILVR